MVLVGKVLKAGNIAQKIKFNVGTPFQLFPGPKKFKEYRN
jgi:hypothetical protein